MKKTLFLCLILWGAADVVSAATVVRPSGLSQAPAERETRICLDLMDLGGNGGEGEDTMELPPMKGELKTAPDPTPSMQLKTPYEPASADAYSGKPLAVPEAEASPGLSPLILSQPGIKGDSKKLPMKPLDQSMEPLPDEPGVSAGKMSSELKPLQPVEAPSAGLKLSTSGRKTVPAPFQSPEIPLLADEKTGVKGSPSPTGSTGAPLTLKSSRQPASAGGKGPSTAAYSLPEDLDSLEQPFGNELDEKLIAIYEKFYQNRK